MHAKSHISQEFYTTVCSKVFLEGLCNAWCEIDHGGVFSFSFIGFACRVLGVVGWSAGLGAMRQDACCMQLEPR